MDLPNQKNKPKLPTKPAGGGAAARQRQADLERGLDVAACPVTPPTDPAGAETSDGRLEPAQAKNAPRKKKKKN
jgi:hypothetical protein